MACQGCQSFCMQGNQLAINGPNGEGCSYPKTWMQWKDIKSYSEDNGKLSIIHDNSTLSAESQKSLVNYIDAVYSEGVKNPNSGLDLGSVQGGGLSLEPDGVPLSSTNIAAAIVDDIKEKSIQTDDINEKSIQTDSIIFAHHYNDLLQPLINDNYSPVSSDPSGKPVSNNCGPGPVAGWPSSENVALVTSGQSDTSDNSLIKAELYRNLYDKASRLLYHPYQCNECNVYQGGDWLEVCKQVKIALADYISAHGFDDGPKESSTAKYSQKAGCDNLNACGVTFDMGRRDCSGYVGSCVYVYGMTQSADVDASFCSWTTNEGFYEDIMTGLGFTYKPAGSDILAGDIKLNIVNHVEVAAEDGGNMVYNCGSNLSAPVPGPTSTAHGASYFDCFWGAPAGGAFGGGTTPPSGDGELVDAEFTGYYPDGSAMEGDWGSSSGEHLDPNNYTCAAPTSVPFNSLVVPQGTGTWIDGKTFRVNDRGGAIVVRPNGRICFDILCFSLNQADILGRVYAKAMLYRK